MCRYGVEIQGDHAAAIQGLLLRHQTATGSATMKGVAVRSPLPGVRLVTSTWNIPAVIN